MAAFAFVARRAISPKRSLGKNVERVPEAIRILRGPRVTLRPFEEADLPLRAKWMADEGASFLMTGRHPDEDELDVQTCAN